MLKTSWLPQNKRNEAAVSVMRLYNSLTMKMRSRERVPIHSSSQKCLEIAMFSILALLRTRAGVDFIYGAVIIYQIYSVPLSCFVRQRPALCYRNIVVGIYTAGVRWLSTVCSVLCIWI